MSGMAGAPTLYRALKRILTPPANRYLYLNVEGLDNVPHTAPAILASNHLSFIDSIVLPLNLPRPVYFLGKADYFDSWRTRWLVAGTGVVPVHRGGGGRGRESLDAGIAILRRGDLLGIYPEGTRSPDGRLYRGKTGPVRMALQAGVTVVPCAVIGTDEAQPRGRHRISRHPVTVRYGRPLDLSRYAGDRGDPFVLRAATDELMFEILTLSGQEYVDEYATNVDSDRVTVDDAADATPGDASDDPGGRRAAS